MISRAAPREAQQAYQADVEMDSETDEEEVGEWEQEEGEEGEEEEGGGSQRPEPSASQRQARADALMVCATSVSATRSATWTRGRDTVLFGAICGRRSSAPGGENPNRKPIKLTASC